MAPCARSRPDPPANEAGQTSSFAAFKSGRLLREPCGPYFIGLRGLTLMHTTPYYCPPFKVD